MHPDHQFHVFANAACPVPPTATTTSFRKTPNAPDMISRLFKALHPARPKRNARRYFTVWISGRYLLDNPTLVTCPDAISQPLATRTMPPNRHGGLGFLHERPDNFQQSLAFDQ